jgi:hypothetical protein
MNQHLKRWLNEERGRLARERATQEEISRWLGWRCIRFDRSKRRLLGQLRVEHECRVNRRMLSLGKKRVTPFGPAPQYVSYWPNRESAT